MKAPDFDYLRPATLDEAIAALAAAGGEAAPLAGGQSLVPMMNFRMARPEVLIDLGRIAELRGIERRGDRVRIGAMTRYRDLAAWPDLARDLPLVALALPHIAHEAIRNRGTLGGSLSLADPAAELPAVMVALDAEIELKGPGGLRRVPAEGFFHGFYETDRRPDELLVAVEVPVSPGRAGFCELAQRHGDYAMAGVAAWAAGTAPWHGLRAAFFGIAGAPVLVDALGAAFEGQQGLPETALAAARAALAGVDFLEDTKAAAATRRHYAGVVLERALKDMLA